MGNSGQEAMNLVGGLEKIGFVDFTVDLVKGVYECIVQASMDQLKAYGEFVNQIAKSVADYQSEIAGGDDAAQKSKAKSYIRDVLGLNPASGEATDSTEYPLTDEQVTALKQHFAGVLVKHTTDSTDDPAKAIDDTSHITDASPNQKIKHAVLQSFVTAKLQVGAEQSYNLIKTILKLGMQKVVVTSGEIYTKLTFSVDASDTASTTSNSYDTKSSGWGISAMASASAIGGITSKILGNNAVAVGGGYSSRKLNVKVVNEQSASAVNVSVDIIGEVRIQFRTETFPSIEA
jgi:hypothetical protein